MQQRVSVTLSSDLLAELDRLIGPGGNRSKTVEKALADYIWRQQRELRDRTDQVALEKHADQLNEEARDVLSYQVPI